MRNRIAVIAAFLSMLAAPAFAAGPVFECAATSNTKHTGALSCLTTGDWIIAVTCGDVGTGTTTISCPSGFTDVTNSQAGPTTGDGNDIGEKVCYKIATGSDTTSSTYTFTYNGTGNGFATSAGMDFRGGTTTFDAAAEAGALDASTLTAPNVTTTLANSAVVMAWCTQGGPTITGNPPTGYTSAYSSGISTNQEIIAAYMTTNPAAGSVTGPALSSSGVSLATNAYTFGGSSGGSPTKTGFFYVP